LAIADVVHHFVAAFGTFRQGVMRIPLVVVEWFASIRV
jgi:hypothetical protein